MHILLTKYNAPLADASLSTRGLDAEWLAHRLALFVRWTVASVRAQTAPPDLWLLFVDSRTPPEALAAIEAALGGLGELVRVGEPLTDALVARLVARRLTGTGTLVTTRLDNDDALGVDALARVDAAAAAAGPGLLGFQDGYIYCDGRLLRRHNRCTPFLSFVERFGGGAGIRTVFQMPHQEAAALGLVRRIPGPAWLQIVHDANIANTAIGWLSTPARASRRLGIPLPPAPLSAGAGAALFVTALLRHGRKETGAAVRRLLTVLRLRRPRWTAALATLEDEIGHGQHLAPRVPEQ